MSKGPGRQAGTAATNLQTSSAATTTSDIYGTGNSAFGPGGLSLGYRAPQSNVLNSYEQNQPTGGYDPDALKSIRGTSANYAITGGVDPAAIARYQKLATEGPEISSESTNAYKDLISGGGLSPESSALYKSFVANGGFTDAQKADYLRQATSGVKGTYNTLAQQVQRQNAATGGMGGGAAAIAQMARQGGQAQSEATLGALNDVNAQIRANELKGAAGLDTGTKNVLTAAQGLTTQDQLRLEGEKVGGQGLLDQASLKMKGLQQQQQTEADVSAKKLGFDSIQQAMSSDNGKMILSMLGIDSSNQQAAINAFLSLSKNPGTFDNILRTITAIKGGSYSFPSGNSSNVGPSVMGDSSLGQGGASE